MCESLLGSGSCGCGLGGIPAGVRVGGAGGSTGDADRSGRLQPALRCGSKNKTCNISS